MSTWNFDRLSAAYAAGWAARLDRCDESVEVLAVELRRDQLGFLLDEPGPMRDMLMDAWSRGVPPAGLKRALRRAIWPLLRSAVRDWASSVGEVVRVMRDIGWEEVDLSWLELPDGHRRLSTDRRGRGWFGSRIASEALSIRTDHAATTLLRRCRDVGSAGREGWAEVPVWLRLSHPAPVAEVMVGTRRIGWTDLPGESWTQLKQAEERHVYADGALFVPMTATAAAPEMTCFLPKHV